MSLIFFAFSFAFPFLAPARLPSTLMRGSFFFTPAIVPFCLALCRGFLRIRCWENELVFLFLVLIWVHLHIDPEFALVSFASFAVFNALTSCALAATSTPAFVASTSAATNIVGFSVWSIWAISTRSTHGARYPVLGPATAHACLIFPGVHL